MQQKHNFEIYVSFYVRESVATKLESDSYGLLLKANSIKQEKKTFGYGAETKPLVWHMLVFLCSRRFFASGS